MDAKPLPLGGSKQRALLALLLLHANGVVSRESLIDGLWGDAPPEAAQASVNVYVSRLRKLLSHNGAAALHTRSPGYLLEVDRDCVDLNRFQDLAAEGARLLRGGNAAPAAETLRAALALWRGPALADLGRVPFAREEQARLEEARLRALEARIEADLAGRHADVVPELERLLADHPYRERFRGQLMLALYRAGRQSDALATYREGRVRLVEELGIEPGPELQQLEQAILRHDPALAAPDQSDGERENSSVSPRVELATSSRWPGRRSIMIAWVSAAFLAVFVVAGVIVARRDSDRPPTIPPNAVGVIDPLKNELVAELPVGTQLSTTGSERGGSAVFDNGAVWVGSTVSRTLVRIDAKTRYATSIGLPAEVLSVAAGQGSVWVTHRFGGISRVDPREESVAETFPLETKGGFTLSAEGITLGEGAVWVGVGVPGQLRLVRLNRESPQEATAGLALGVRSDHDIAIGEGAIWVTNTLGNRLLRVSLDGAAVVDEIPLAGPTSVAVGQGAVWVASEVDDVVWRIDSSTNLPTRQIAVGDGPVDIVVGEGAVWVANSLDGTVSRIDPVSDSVVATIRVAEALAAVAAGGGFVWAVSADAE